MDMVGSNKNKRQEDKPPSPPRAFSSFSSFSSSARTPTLFHRRLGALASFPKFAEVGANPSQMWLTLANISDIEAPAIPAPQPPCRLPTSAPYLPYLPPDIRISASRWNLNLMTRLPQNGVQSAWRPCTPDCIESGVTAVHPFFPGPGRPNHAVRIWWWAPQGLCQEPRQLESATGRVPTNRQHQSD